MTGNLHNPNFSLTLPNKPEYSSWDLRLDQVLRLRRQYHGSASQQLGEDPAVLGDRPRAETHPARRPACLLAFEWGPVD